MHCSSITATYRRCSWLALTPRCPRFKHLIPIWRDPFHLLKFLGSMTIPPGQSFSDLGQIWGLCIKYVGFRCLDAQLQVQKPGAREPSRTLRKLAGLKYVGFLLDAQAELQEAGRHPKAGSSSAVSFARRFVHRPERSGEDPAQAEEAPAGAVKLGLGGETPG